MADIIAVLREHGVQVFAHDPLADPAEVEEEFGIELNDIHELSGFDGVILAVPHTYYLDISNKNLAALLSTDGIFIDVKAVLDKEDFSFIQEDQLN